MKLIIDVDEKLVCDGFERSFTEEERNTLIRAIGNGKSYNPSGDLISREALRKAFHERIYYFDKSGWDEANALIDKALTVEPDITNEDLQAVRTESYHLGYALAEITFRRLQGEWIIVKDKKYGDNVKCPFCGKELAGTDLNFCCKCGADMRIVKKGGA